jgi:hypothetical protein
LGGEGEVNIDRLERLLDLLGEGLSIINDEVYTYVIVTV